MCGPGPTTPSRKDETLANRLAGDAVSWALLADLHPNPRSKVAVKRIARKREPHFSLF
jgi:hypothetical protein